MEDVGRIHDDALDSFVVLRGHMSFGSTESSEHAKEPDTAPGNADDHERDRGNAGHHHGRGDRRQSRQHGDPAGAMVREEHRIPQRA
ncbi:MAG: hypothetical protein HYY76_04355 [Acidobacteria bacterium]|nr:hypothetical protein [Acidobacteriota bacterium]